jgi:LysM repeat protein/ABC-type branched-subunit amino acid transport system substrate-binding protein
MRKILIILPLLFFFTISHAQVSISLSKEVIEENGLNYYIHTVEKGHTLYSLSKAYGVPQEQIMKLNPELADGLKLGQKIKIPKLDQVADGMSASPKDTLPPSEYGFIFHKVKKGETLYRIMKQRQVDLATLQKYNPGLTANIHPDQYIKIPTADLLISKAAENQYDSLITYTIKKRDTYSKLERKYRINQSALEQLNPILKEKGLQKDMDIKIPYAPEMPEQDLNAAIELASPVIEKPTDSVMEKKLGCDSNIIANQRYKLALMMPLYAYLEKDIRTDNDFFIKEQNEYPSFRFIHYYEGFMLALDSMKSLGFNADVYVYDTRADSIHTQQFISKAEFSDLDIIIGPFFARNLQKIVPAAQANQTWVASPFSSGNGLEKMDNLFVLGSQDYSLWKKGMKFLRDSMPQAHVYVLHNESKSELEELNRIKINYRSTHGGDTSHLHIYSYKSKGFYSLLGELKKDQDNVLINLSTNEAYISNFVRQLNQKVEDYPIVLMGREKHWKSFLTLEVEYLVKLRLTLLSTSFIDYRQAQTKHFVQLFQEKYKTDPSAMAFKGFDDAFYFMNLLLRYGRNFTPCMNQLNFQGLQQDYFFPPSSGRKHMNTEANVYQYFNYQLVDKCKVLEQEPEEELMEENESEKEDKHTDTE